MSKNNTFDYLQTSNEEFLDLFRKENGSYLCKELLGCDLATDEEKKYAMEKQLFVEFCPKMVESATVITKKLLNS